MKMLKYLIFGGIILTAVIGFSFIQINEKKQSAEDSHQKKITIDGFIRIHRPYCGGAYPTPEMERGTYAPFANSYFYIVLKNDTSRTAIRKFQTNEKGYFQIKLFPGEYSIFGENKMRPFNEFVKNNSGDGDRLVCTGRDCLKEWYDTPDYSLKAHNDTTIEITFYSGCFTGINPCLQYTGPLPM